MLGRLRPNLGWFRPTSAGIDNVWFKLDQCLVHLACHILLCGLRNLGGCVKPGCPWPLFRGWEPCQHTLDFGEIPRTSHYVDSLAGICLHPPGWPTTMVANFGRLRPHSGLTSCVGYGNRGFGGPFGRSWPMFSRMGGVVKGTSQRRFVNMGRW